MNVTKLWPSFCVALGLLITLQLASAAVRPLFAVCAAPGWSTDDEPVSIHEIVARVESEQPTYIFVGERHQVGPVKRFAVDLSNALVDAGYDVGLYVEGFRTDCDPRDSTCQTLARIFDAEAFDRLLEESRAPVHPIDPPERDRRATRMAEVIGGGTETIRVVLVGNSHVLYAGDPEAEHWVFGGGMLYPDPGDLVEAFPRERSLTVALIEAAAPGEAPYSLQRGGCASDYTLAVEYSGAY